MANGYCSQDSLVQRERHLYRVQQVRTKNVHLMSKYTPRTDEELMTFLHLQISTHYSRMK